MKWLDREALPDPLRPLSNRTLAVCIACLLLALSLSACGGGDPEPEEPEPVCVHSPLECK